jgi:hypothetical protein
MWRGARKLWAFLLQFFIIEWLLGVALFYSTKSLPQYVSIPLVPFAAFIGLAIAAIPTAFEIIWLPFKTESPIEMLQKRLTKLLLKLGAMLRYNFAEAIAVCREQDAYDCQQLDSWGLGLRPEIVRRRIRILYEFHKSKIAEKHRDATFLHYDVNYNPWDQFYPLVKHIGRKRLRACIKNPTKTHCPNWDGSERRRVKGSKTNRDPLLDSDPSRSRIYDDQNLVKRITNGQMES